MGTRRFGGIRAAVAAVVVALMAVACSSSSKSAVAPNPTPSSAPPATPATSPTSVRRGGVIKHVFVIDLENKDYSETFGPSSPARFLNGTLVPAGQLLTDYYGIGHASLDNYIAQISGQAPNPTTQSDCPRFVNFQMTGTGAYGQALGKGCVYPSSVKTVADQLTAAGKTWKEYAEDIGNSAVQPKTCRHPQIGSVDTTLVARKGDMYATRHDPFVYFHSIIDTPACAALVVGLDQLGTDLASVATTPNLAFITPNLCHDGHDAPCVDSEPGGLISSDQWLAQWVPRILSSPAFRRDGMLVVTFDEAEVSAGATDASACCATPPDPNSAMPGGSGPGGGRVGAVVVSVLTKAGSTNATPYNHYGLLCSIENVFGLSHLGFAGAPGTPCFGKDVFNGSASEP